jgi:hypothetical protein
MGEIREAIRMGTLLDYYNHYKSHPARLETAQTVHGSIA